MKFDALIHGTKRIFLGGIGSCLSGSHLTRRCSQPLAGIKTHDNMTIDHRQPDQLAPASGGSAPSR